MADTFNSGVIAFTRLYQQRTLRPHSVRQEIEMNWFRDLPLYAQIISLVMLYALAAWAGCKSGHVS
jgi:hypothetical protein